MSDFAPIYGINPSGVEKPVQTDANGNLIMQPGNTANTTPWLTVNDVYTYTRINSNTTTAIKSGAGHLHTITVNNPGSAWVVTVYDNTAGSGTQIAAITPVAGLIITLEYDVVFNTGLTIVTSGTTAGDITVASR